MVGAPVPGRLRVPCYDTSLYIDDLHLADDGEAAALIAQEARELAARSQDKQLDAETRHAVARCHFYLADFMPALEYLLEAAQIYEDCGDMAGAATAFAPRPWFGRGGFGLGQDNPPAPTSDPFTPPRFRPRRFR